MERMFDYVRIAKLLAIGLVSVPMVACQIYNSWPFHKRIKSQEELDQIVQEESEKIGLDHTKIKAKICRGMCSARKNGKIYEIDIASDWERTRNSVCHELYHIYKGHCEPSNHLVGNSIDGILREELPAALYETFGIKI